VVILGASARSAAWSAVRAGLLPAAADLYADRDLRAVAGCTRVPAESYPERLVAAAQGFPPGPWLYTGALENRPDLIARVASSRPLWGNDAAAVRAVRDPLALADALRTAGLHAPDARLDASGLPRDGSWLRKPLASAGGVGIEPLRAETRLTHTGSSDYYQKWVRGTSLSALFVGWGGAARTAGVTRQFVGRRGAEFAYRGSLFLDPVGGDLARRIEAVGRAVASRFGLVGLFGVDLILGTDGTPWAVEVNPRYTASVEVIELSLGRALMTDHRLACEGLPLGPPGRGEGAALRFVAKEIVFADSPCVFPGEPVAFEPRGRDAFRVPRCADLPDPGTILAAGDPVMTVFGVGANPGAALRDAAETRETWRGRLAGEAPTG